MTKRPEGVERPDPVKTPKPTRGSSALPAPVILVNPDVVERCLNYWLCTHSPIIRITQNEKAEIGCACGWRPQVEGQTYRQHIGHELAIHVAQSLNHELRR